MNSRPLRRLLLIVLGAGGGIVAGAQVAGMLSLQILGGDARDASPLTAVQLAELVKLLDQGALTSTGAKSVFAAMLAAGNPADASPAAIVRRLGLDQALSAAELAAAVDQVLAALPDKVAEYRNGKASLLGMVNGQVIKATGGKSSPHAVQTRLKDRLAWKKI